MNKFNLILDEVEDSIHSTDSETSLVKERISNYFGSNIDELLSLAKGDAIVYGGAVRDSIANLEIHDIDIMALPKASRIIAEKLLQMEFKSIPFTKVDIASLYTGLHIINEPWTFIKSNTIVQIIRPVVKPGESPRKALKSCIDNVDISCCGVAYIPNALWETCQDALLHCRHKVFRVLKENLLYRPDRISHRTAKLCDRGWKDLDFEKNMSL